MYVLDISHQLIGLVSSVFILHSIFYKVSNFLIMEGNSSASEAKALEIRKKVLEAMAKLNLKKQLEQEESMKAPSKPKPIDTPEKHEYQPLQELEYVKTQRKEIDVGISEYVCKGPGFYAIIKERYSDFQVKSNMFIFIIIFNVFFVNTTGS